MLSKQYGQSWFSMDPTRGRLALREDDGLKTCGGRCLPACGAVTAHQNQSCHTGLTPLGSGGNSENSTRDSPGA